MKPTKTFTPDKTFKLYDKTITIDFYEKYGRYSHVYIERETGVWPISVTAAVGMVDKSMPLMLWQEKITKKFLLGKLEGGKITQDDILQATALHRTKKEEAADKGTAVHDFAEQYIKYQLKQVKEKPEQPKDENVLNGAMAFLNWMQANKIKPIASEQLVYSKKNKYVGTLDFKAIINGKLAVIDFKSGKPCEKKNKKGEIIDRKPYPAHRYQVAGYRNADEEETGKEYQESWIIYFDKETADFYPFKLDNYNKDLKAFLGALTLRKREKELSKAA